MRTVYKYPFKITDKFTIDMKDDAHILTAFMQDDTPCLWAEVDSDMRRIAVRKFAIVGTGGPMPQGIKRWIATFPERQFIWHLYEFY